MKRRRISKWNAKICLRLALASLLIISVLGCRAPASKSPEETGGTADSTPTGTADSVIKVGFVGSLTGSQAEVGEYCRDGLKLAIDEINSSGGIKGMKVELIAEDDESNPSKAVSATTKLVEKDKVLFVIGSNSTPPTLSMMEVTERYGVPQMTTNSSGPLITRSGAKWIFRLHPDDSRQAVGIVDYMSNYLKPQAVAILYINNDYGKGGMMEITNYYKEKYDYTPVAIEAYNPGDKEFSSQLLKIKGKNADAVIISGDYPEGALIIRQAHQLGYRPQFCGLGGMGEGDFPKLAGEDGIGTIATIPWFPNLENPQERTWFEQATKKLGYEPTSAVAQSYDAMMVFAKAIEMEGPDRQKIKDALRGGLSIQGVTGKVTFDDTGNSIYNVNIIRVKDPKTKKPGDPDWPWERLWPK